MTVRKGYEYLNGYELIQKCQVGSPSPKPASSLASNQTSITHSPNTVVATHDTRTKNANRSLMAVNKDFINSMNSTASLKMLHRRVPKVLCAMHMVNAMKLWCKLSWTRGRGSAMDFLLRLQPAMKRSELLICYIRAPRSIRNCGPW